MQFFITGSTGFIGRELTVKLAREGSKIHLLVRSRDKAEYFSKYPGVTVFEGDITDSEAVLKSMQGCTHVFHLAALAKASVDHPDEFYDANVKGTYNILESALMNNVEKVIFTSSAATLRSSAANMVIDEESEKPGEYLTEYARTKAIAEKMCLNYWQSGLNVVIVSPSRVYGPGILSESNGVTRIFKLYEKGKWRFIPGDGEIYGNYVFIGDVVNGHILAMQKGIPGQTYILGGEDVTYNQMINIFRLVTGKKYFQVKIPTWILFLVSFIVNAGFGILQKKSFLTPAWVKKFLQHQRLSVAKAKKDLGYSVTPFAEGISKTFSWLKQNQQT
jgi:NAD+-dependent farnesol dehydrogenase